MNMHSKEGLIDSINILRNKIDTSVTVCDTEEFYAFYDEVINNGENDKDILDALENLRVTIETHNKITRDNIKGNKAGLPDNGTREFTEYKNKENREVVLRHFYNDFYKNTELEHCKIHYDDLKLGYRRILSFSIVCPLDKSGGARIEDIDPSKAFNI